MDLRLDPGDLLQRLLSTSVQRHEVLMGNVANANTPGFQRRTLLFEEFLRDADARGGDLTRIEPKLELDSVTPGKPDGNNVSLEIEMNALRENKLLYESYAAILAAKFDLIRTSLETSR